MKWFGPQGDCSCCDCVAPACTLTGDSDCNVGSYVELTWTTTNADTVELKNDSDVVLSTSLNGTLLIPDGACVTYTLTATNECGTSTCSFYCCDCDGCTLNPIPDPPCEECAETDDPVSFATPRDVQISISGVTAGVTGNCGWLDAVACETNAAGTNIGFFNGDIVIGPCDSAVFTDCRLICEFTKFLWAFGYMMEFNRIEVFSNIAGPTTIAGVQAEVTVHIESWIGALQHGVARTEEYLCQQLLDQLFFEANLTPLGSAISSHRTYSHRIRRVVFKRTTGVKYQWKYDIATCPEAATDSETDLDCNERIYIPACAPSGWEITEFSDSLVEAKQTDGVTVCTKANDVGAATIAVETV